MAKISKDSAGSVKDFGVAEERSDDVEGYNIGFVSIREGHDLAPMLSVLPTGRCECPHWGYVFGGELTVTYPDRVETYGPGDAFYMPPGHTPSAATGTEFVIFSPSDELAATNAAIEAGLAAMQQQA